MVWMLMSIFVMTLVCFIPKSKGQISIQEVRAYTATLVMNKFQQLLLKDDKSLVR